MSRSATPVPVVQRQDSAGRVLAPAVSVVQRQVSNGRHVTPEKSAPTGGQVKAAQRQDLNNLPRFQPPMWHASSLPVPESPDPTPLLEAAGDTPHTLEENRSLLSSLFPGDLDSASHERHTFSQWPQPDDMAADDNKENKISACNAPPALTLQTPSSVCSYSTSSEQSEARADEDFDVPRLEILDMQSEPRADEVFDVPRLEVLESRPEEPRDLRTRELPCESPLNQSAANSPADTPEIVESLITKEATEEAYTRGPGRWSSQTDRLSETSLVFPQVVLGATLAESTTTQSSVTSAGGIGPVSTAATLSPSIARVADDAPSPSSVPQPTRFGIPRATLQVSELQVTTEPAAGHILGRGALHASFSGFTWPEELCPEDDVVADSPRQGVLDIHKSNHSSPVKVDCGWPEEMDGPDSNLQVGFSHMRLRSFELCTPGTQGSTGGTGGCCNPSPCSPLEGCSGAAEAHQASQRADLAALETELPRMVCRSAAVEPVQWRGDQRAAAVHSTRTYAFSYPTTDSRYHEFACPTSESPAFPKIESPSPELSPVEAFLASCS